MTRDTLYWTGFFVAFWAPILLILGLISSPFGIITSGLVAHDSQLSYRKRFLRGWGCWTCGILPGIYFVLTAMGVHVGRGWIVAAYLFWFILWTWMGLAGGSILLHFYASPDPFLNHDGTSNWQFLLVGVAVIINFVLWIGTLAIITRAPNPRHHPDEPLLPSLTIPIKYLWPYVAGTVGLPLVSLAARLGGIL